MSSASGAFAKSTLQVQESSYSPYVQADFWGEVESKWKTVKVKAVEYYQKYFGDKPTQTAQQPTTENRVPSSENQAPLVPAVPANALPSFVDNRVIQQTEDIKKVRTQLAQEKATLTTVGRAADPSLRKRKSGVATFDPYEADTKAGKKGSKLGQKRLKVIPELDIGVEDQIVMNKFTINLPSSFTLQFEKIKELPTPDMNRQSVVDNLTKAKLEKALAAEKFERIVLSLPKDITAENVKSILLNITQSFDVIELAYTQISANELQLIKGLILTEYKDRCHVGTGLLYPLKDMSGEAKDLRDYYYSSCLYKMGFYTDGVRELTKVIRQNNKFTKQAVDLVVVDYKREYASQLASALKDVSNSNVNEKNVSEFHYLIALGESISKAWKSSLQHAVKVDARSDKYVEAQYLASVSEYMLGDIKSSLARQENLLKDIDKKKSHDNVKSLLMMNMGRAAYRNKQYKKAIEAYRFINKENPLWFQALIEQGWMQILSGDAPGAVGNMFSIQMPQFKDLYKPESYAVRTIGYLNICQYGDAQKTIEHLNKIYRPWISAMKKEQAKQQYNYQFYGQVITALKTSDNKTNLPFPILREIARHKDFLNIQEAINNKVDEEAQYSYIRNLAEKDKSASNYKYKNAKDRARDFDKKIKTASSDKGNLQNVGSWKASRVLEDDVADYYTFEGKVIDESIDYFKNFTKQSVANLKESKEDLKSSAGKTMRARLAGMQKKLEKMMENNEFLTYEVYSGSGESIRYVSAGGNVKGTASTRETASKESKGKLYLWDFDGEYWSDEVGNYKSSLKDNCPSANNLQKVQ